MSAGALRRLALLAATVLAIIGIAVPAGAAEPLGSKNFTAPRYAPDYFSSESAPFHTVPGAPRHAVPQRYAAPAAPRYSAVPAAPRYAAPVAAAPSVRGASEARYRRTPIRANAGRAVRHAERRHARHRPSTYAARRLSRFHARSRRHVHHRNAARRRAALHAAHAHRRLAEHATRRHHRIAHTAGRNTGGRL